MGEYIKYRGEEMKIGTCESLYYVTYPKYIRALLDGRLSPVDITRPEEYATADSGFRFRFPFPDEDKLEFGDIAGTYDRGIPITVSSAVIPYDEQETCPAKLFYQIEITQQKLIHRQSDGKLCLAVVCRDPLKTTSFRIEDDSDIKNLLTQIISNHIVRENDPVQKLFYRQIAGRILKGYRLATAKMEVKAELPAALKKQTNRALPFPKPKKGFKKAYNSKFKI